MSDAIYIGVDLGGTRIRSARCDEDLNILYREETLTLAHEGLEPTLNRIKDMIRRVLPADMSHVKGIGVSAPGPLNPETGIVVAPPNLPGWHNVPLGDIISAEFGLPAYIGNDANVAVLAEVLNGAAVGCKNAIFITVSTGIGGGIISDGYMVLGHTGLGAEVGHMILVADDNVSSLELEAAGPALARRAKKLIEAGQPSIIMEMVDGDASKIDGAAVGNAALKGDSLALDVVTYGAKMLGLGIVTLLHVFNPEIVIIGGGVANGLGDLLLKPMQETIQKYAIDSAYWENLKIVPPEHPEDLSILGSAALVIAEGGVKHMDEMAKRLDESQQN